MKKLLMTTAICLTLTAAPLSANALDGSSVVKNYAEIVYTTYLDTYNDALALQRSIDNFLANPTEENLEEAKRVWLISRDSYGQTEAFRFYEGPIDGENGPEGQLNAWPVNEAYIDYVVGDSDAGIVQDKSISITEEMLSNKNQLNDEADVSTGYHAIEFLLWGQDLSLDSAGTRPASDYAKSEENKRRREYLKEVTNLLVNDIKFLVDSWKPNSDNYAKEFTSGDSDKALSNILTALATLSGFELASERMATALDSGDQEDEHSCFSDNTHNDFLMNAKGISNVFFGRYEKIEGDSVYKLLAKEDKTLAEKIKDQILKTDELLSKVPYPIDREVLATEKGSSGRESLERVVTSLQKQADLFKKAGKVLGLNVQIAE